MTFRKFVNEQIARLTAFEDFNRLADTGKKEYSDLLFDLAQEPQPKRDRSALDWLDSAPARNVKAVIDEGIEFQKHPTLYDIRAIWKRLIAAPLASARQQCERCHGTGFVEVEGPFGLSSAYPCTHQPETEQDRRMGLRMTPVQARSYMREMKEAAPRAAVWQGTGGHVKQDELKRVNLATIGKILQDVL